MSKKILIVILAIVVVAAAVWYFMLPKKQSQDLGEQAMIYCSQENISSVEISRSARIIKTTSSLLGGGATYYPADGQSFSCPVVAPEYISEDCQSILEIDDWEQICASKPFGNDDVGGITAAFAAKYDKQESEISVTISQQSGDYFRGGVLFGAGGAGEGGNFFALKQGNEYRIVFDGNGAFSCQMLDFFGFPESMQDECYNEPEGTYSNKKLGLFFVYPGDFGEVQLEIRGGETGEMFYGTFSKNSEFLFGGISEDYSAGRGGTLTDTRGFFEQGGTYYFKFVAAKSETGSPLQPLKIIEKDFGEILILDDKSFEAERLGVEGPIIGVGEGNLAGLLNLGGEKFPGVVFWNGDTERLPQGKFEMLLFSIEILEQ